jgi:hypothetical protein
VETTYRCSDGRTFGVVRDSYEADVAYANELYSLQRRPSSIGVRYASTEASLVVDGPYAAFVTETVVDLPECREWRG